jgi:4-amino-4-deoxy-L-arabinose transferase-like glycosyltransferase
MNSSGGANRMRLPLALGGTLLTLYGSLGLLLDLHLPERVAEGLAFWRAAALNGLSTAVPAVSAESFPAWLNSLRGYFDQAVLPVWLAWGGGILLLLLAAGRRPGISVAARVPLSWRDGVAGLFLLGVLVLGYLLRARFLLPVATGALPASNYDEMVYLEAALLWARGVPPYAGFFLAHPPGIMVALRPAVWVSAPWGGEALLLAGRWLQCGYGLLSVVLLYLVGREIGGRRAGLLAALVMAVDVQAVQVAPLETVANVGAVAALWLYLLAQRRSAGWGRFALAAGAGALATCAALTKAPGAVVLLLLGLLALLAWQWRDLLAGAVGGVFVGAAAGLVFVLRAPGAFWRPVVAFQLLRPQETTYARNHLARMADYPESRVTFVLLIAAVVLLGTLALVEAWRAPGEQRERWTPAGPWAWVLPLAVVVLLLLFLFSFGRAFHSRYYIQLLAFLALLIAAGVGALAPRLSSWPRWGRILALLAALVLAFLFLPQIGQQVLAAGQVEYDRSYQVVGQALQNAVPPDRTVLALDPGYPVMAGRPPALLPDGTRLVDGAGLLAYRALGVAGMGVRQVWESAQASSREVNPKAVFHQPAAQDLVVSALFGGGGEAAPGAAVIDMRIAAEDLTPQTQEFLRTRGQQIAWEQYTAAFSVERVALLGQNRSGLALWDFNMRSLTAQGEGPAAQPGQPLEIPVGGVVQVSLYWYVAQPPTTTLKVGLELQDSSGKAVAHLWELPHFGEPPTNLWLARWVYQDHHNLLLSADVLPGEYTLSVGLLDSSSSRPWPWSGNDQPDSLAIGSVRVVP